MVGSWNNGRLWKCGSAKWGRVQLKIEKFKNGKMEKWRNKMAYWYANILGKSRTDARNDFSAFLYIRYVRLSTIGVLHR